MRGTKRLRRTEFFGCALVLLLLGFGMWWGWYKYQECRKVGHSALYCAMGVLD